MSAIHVPCIGSAFPAVTVRAKPSRPCEILGKISLISLPSDYSNITLVLATADYQGAGPACGQVGVAQPGHHGPAE